MDEATYTFAAVAKILEVPESKLRYWAQVGFVGPSVRKSGKQLYSFQDLVSVKAAKELVDRGLKVAEIRKALDKVRSALPQVDRPLDRLRVAFDGNALVVVDGATAFEASGQQVFQFGLSDLAARAGTPSAPPAAAPPAPAPPAAGAEAATGAAIGAGVEARDAGGRTAYPCFAEAMRLEEVGRIDDAEAGYRQALALDPGLAAAHTNLGRLAHRRGDVVAARAAFEAALAIDPDQPEARFNLANMILEDGDVELAVAELRRVLQSAPDFAEAHYNLAVALERLGGRAQARAHLERYLGLPAAAAAADRVLWTTNARLLIARLTD